MLKTFRLFILDICVFVFLCIYFFVNCFFVFFVGLDGFVCFRLLVVVVCIFVAFFVVALFLLKLIVVALLVRVKRV